MKVLVISMILIYAMFLLGGTAYLIGWHDWNPWWMLLAILLLPDWSSK